MTSQTIDAYIAEQDSEIRPVLVKVREIIGSAIPDASEKMSYGIPTWWAGRNIIHFSAAKKHLGLYPGPKAIAAFQDQLAEYDQSKGTIRFPLNSPIPYELIADISRWCLENYRK
ncbi:MAG: DUF1801 domain-containing protein [Microbacteriaceae bacterium]|nr:DUF1801 domain-containing protein [Microbacteriaceae bacterium]